MLRNITDRLRRRRRGFTLAEVLIAAIIGTLVITSAWSVYMMVWQWWAEISPRIGVERKARLVLLQVIEGVPDSTTGSYTINSVSYNRRNGIAWATAYPDIYTSSGTAIPASNGDAYTGVRIKYRLSPDSANVRELYVGDYNGKKAVYYKSSASATPRALENTAADDIVLTFKRLSSLAYVTSGGSATSASYKDPTTNNDHENIVIVAVTLTDNVFGTRTNQPYGVTVRYSDTVYLRNKI